MIVGISGSLLSHDAFDHVIANRLRERLDESGSERARRRLRAWHLQLRAQLGPTATPRTLYDRLATPLFSHLGYRVIPSAGAGDVFRATLQSRGTARAALLVISWGRDTAGAWREAVLHGIGTSLPWCFCLNGPVLRLVDSRRTYSRRFLQFDLTTTLDDPRSFRVLWGLLRSDSLASPVLDGKSLFDAALALSEDYRADVRDSLQAGVHEALFHLDNAFRTARTSTPRRRRMRSPAASDLFNEALIVVYRVLFLLFAEARGLVPRWHPVYRDAYTIEALREPVEHLPRPRGLWESLQAIARLAHSGCRVGALHVPPFNGHLFSPADAPVSDLVALDEGAVRQAMLALTTRAVRSGRVRVAYGDLGVEQLGGVYERLLDVEPGAPPARPRGPQIRTTSVRKSTGSFYTPRSITEFLVRRTLAPLVSDATPDRILALRIVDPAMGSGAFLVAACRYLASAYELALLREGGFVSSDITETERASFRRVVAQQCLYGVDINPMAVQLGRLSLWLATLSAGRPLTFLDHRLQAGNSLVGASFEDILRQPPGGSRAKYAPLPLFSELDIDATVRHAVGVRAEVAAKPDDTLEQVQWKERAMADLARERTIARWKSVADLWCAHWFADRRQTAGSFGALADALLGRFNALPPHTSARLLQGAQAAAHLHRFFHWTFEFPEIFYESTGEPKPGAGFDAVIGNPPWEMLRGDLGAPEGRTAARNAAARLTDFTRSSGIYRLQGSGHANLYQLFLERALSLLRDGGRLGLILPSAFAVDRGSSRLRRALLECSSIDGFVSFENRDAVFPIHRSMKFLLVTAAKGGPSSALPCRFGVRSPAELDAMPDSGSDPGAITLTRSLLERVDADGLVIPDLRTTADVEIVSDIAFRFPALGDEEGWHVSFGRELNATDDRAHFVDAGGGRNMPVIEGKHLSPFVVDTKAATAWLPLASGRRLLGGKGPFARPRLAYRDVAGATNRLSLIAAIVPAGCITTHTLFCLKDPIDLDVQHFLCGIFNSFVANYLVRTRINTHVSASIIDRLPVPVVEPGAESFRTIASLSVSLSEQESEVHAARLQAAAARLYGLRMDQFARILGTFPLIPAAIREAARRAFCDIVG
jgi:hypothetical protein